MALPLTASLPQSGNIVSRWKLNESSGNALDNVGSNNLTDNNTVASAAGQFGENARDFETGNTESFSITDGSQSGLDITGDMTVSFWFRAESSKSHRIFNKYYTGTNQRSYAVDVTTTHIRFLNTSNGQTGTEQVGSVAWAFSLATWYHITVVYDASAGEVEAFVNGSSVGTDTGNNTSLHNGSSNVYVGDAGPGGDPMDGMLQDLIVWNFELSSANVTSLYAAYTSSNLVSIERHPMRGVMRGVMRP